jgi:predicted nuclease with TOPRIM domain
MSRYKRTFSETFPSTNPYGLDNLIYHDINPEDFSPDFIRDLHKKIINNPMRQITVRDHKTGKNFTGIERKNLIVRFAIVCRDLLKFKQNERVRFVRADILSYVINHKIIELIYESPYERGDDIFIITPFPQKINDRQCESFVKEGENYDHYHKKPRNDYISEIDELKKKCDHLSFCLKKKTEDADYFYDTISTKTKTINEITSKLESMKKEKDEVFLKLNNTADQCKEFAEKISDLNTAIDHITEEKQNMFQYFNYALMQRGTEICRLQDQVTEMLKKEEQNTLVNQTAKDPIKMDLIDPRIMFKLERSNAALLSTVNGLTKQLDQQDKANSSISRQLAELQSKSNQFLICSELKEQENQLLIAKIAQLEEENSKLQQISKGVVSKMENLETNNLEIVAFTELQKESRAVQISPTNITLELSKRNTIAVAGLESSIK